MILELEHISNNFLSELNIIQKRNDDIMVCATKAIGLSRNTLNQFKRIIFENDFESIEDEVLFFKNIKQIPLEPLVYYSEIRSFELQFPMANISVQKKCITKKIAKLNRFFNYNIDFVQYTEQDFSHFDKHFYTRQYADTYHIISSKFYFQDPDFTTARDMLLSKVRAYRKFIKYLQSRLAKEKSKTINTTSPKLKWTATKAALTELIYALHSSNSVNNGNTDIKFIAEALQSIFQFDLGDFYKVYAEIKSRKKSRTKFLDDLSKSLIIAMDNSEK